MTTAFIDTFAVAKKDAATRLVHLRHTGACQGMTEFAADELTTEQKSVLERVCASCPVYEDCLSYSLTYERWGFWAGLTEGARAILRRSKRVRLIDVYGFAVTR